MHLETRVTRPLAQLSGFWDSIPGLGLSPSRPGGRRRRDSIIRGRLDQGTPSHESESDSDIPEYPTFIHISIFLVRDFPRGRAMIMIIFSILTVRPSAQARDKQHDTSSLTRSLGVTQDIPGISLYQARSPSPIRIILHCGRTGPRLPGHRLVLSEFWSACQWHGHA